MPREILNRGLTRRVLEYVRDYTHHQPFTTHDLSTKTVFSGIPASSIASSIRNLQDHGMLERVAHGIYRFVGDIPQDPKPKKEITDQQIIEMLELLDVRVVISAKNFSKVFEWVRVTRELIGEISE